MPVKHHERIPHIHHSASFASPLGTPWTPEGSPIDRHATPHPAHRTPEGSPIDRHATPHPAHRTPEGSPIDSLRIAQQTLDPGGVTYRSSSVKKDLNATLPSRGVVLAALEEHWP